MQDGGEEGSAVAAVEDTTDPQIDVTMDVAVLLCRACLLPLKPPIFKVSSRLRAKMRNYLPSKLRVLLVPV